LVWSVKDGVEHRVFRDLPHCLNSGDLLVLNDTRVLPARLLGRKVEGGGRAEILLLAPVGGYGEADFCRWRALVRPGRRLPAGVKVRVGDRILTVESRGEEGTRIVNVGTDKEDVLSFLGEHGRTPLPPYIKAADTAAVREAYQTVFALNDGSVAAPTASLHFTKDLLKRIEEKGVEIAWVTLHVGLGTFRPVKVRDIREHGLHGETCVVPPVTEDAIRRCRSRHGRVIAGGTTVARTLESMAAENGLVRSGMMETKLFIYPGFLYRVVDALITNFHLPKSSLLMLVAAFVNSMGGGAGREEEALTALRTIYACAVAEGYRFFSFGDAMFIKK
jgi:S-adenosylmethionine:tRNA ribosyltransferase-isomerase